MTNRGLGIIHITEQILFSVMLQQIFTKQKIINIIQTSKEYYVYCLILN